MTKEITKAYIIQQIEQKFKLRELAPETFAFQETVVPVYNIEQHLLVPVRKDNKRTITSTGADKFFTVPESERWILHRYMVIFWTGVFTVAGVMAGRPTASTYIYLDLTAAQSASYLNDLPKDAILNAGEGLYINIDGYTSSGDIELILDTTVETIR